jgi:hypothetical protein
VDVETAHLLMEIYSMLFQHLGGVINAVDYGRDYDQMEVIKVMISEHFATRGFTLGFDDFDRIGLFLPKEKREATL